MKKLLQISVFALLGGAVLSSCKKPSTVYPIEPQIDLVEAHVEKDDDFYTYVVTFNFTDGDGDMGLADGDTFGQFNDTGIYYYNLHADYYEKVNGSFKKIAQSIVGDTIELFGRFPVLTPEGSAKAIKGTIVARLVLGYWEPASDRSNITKLKIWVNDRALHKSNVIETPEIMLN